MGQKREFLNTPEETKVIKTIERTRIAVCFVGVFRAFELLSNVRGAYGRFVGWPHGSGKLLFR